MTDGGPGDSRSIENPTKSSETLADVPVEGEAADDAGASGERVSKPGEGLVTEEGVNERKTGSP